MIKAIETTYKGYRFRSRLEARWAVFFDAVGLEWKYEYEGYELKSQKGKRVHYLPDFWLPKFEMFVEVKGVDLTKDEEQKCELLAEESGFAVLAVIGLPYEKPSWLFAWDTTDSGGGSYCAPVTFYFHKHDPGLSVHQDDPRIKNGDREIWLRDGFTNP